MCRSHMRISLADKLDALLNFRYHPSYWVGSGACCSDVTDLPLSASSNVADYDLSIRQLSLQQESCTCTGAHVPLVSPYCLRRTYSQTDKQTGCYRHICLCVRQCKQLASRLVLKMLLQLLEASLITDEDHRVL